VAGPDSAAVSLRALFALFLKIGLSFGAGTGMSAVLQDELVGKRHAIRRGDFMVLYGLARLVPSGSMTALAVAIGYRYQRLAGTVVVLFAMIAPGFTLMVLLTIAYQLLVGSPVMRVLELTLMPAAVALVVVSTFRLGAEFFTFGRRKAMYVPSVELLLVIGGGAGVLAFGFNPALVLLAGGCIGAVLIRQFESEDHA
jgi:chromate transporter